MNTVQILDCTLRDGGRIINCEFSDLQIRRIIYYLQQANIDIIEVGFLRDGNTINYNGNSTFFTDVKQISRLLPQKRSAIYVAFIDFGMFDFDTLEKCDGKSIDGIRFGFTKSDYETSRDQIIECAKLIKRNGYKLFLQGVNSLSYTDSELLQLIGVVNEIEPYSFGIVDTYGAMYADDVHRIYNLADHNLKQEIAIDFHSHNNFQLSFSLAQEIIALSRGTRNIIIDATLRGMGKGAGNANTELIADYLTRKKGYDYDLEKLLEIIDLELYDIYEKNQWGYSPASFMAGIYKSHPNNIIYLLDKYNYTTNDIKNILSMLSDGERQHYPYEKIDMLCREYNFKDYNDQASVAMLKKMIRDKPVLLLAPGKSLEDKKEDIDLYIDKNEPVIISVNFVSDYNNALSFFGNRKRYYSFCYEKRKENTTIVTSDVSTDDKTELVISVNRLYKEKCGKDGGSMLKLLVLLQEIGVSQIAIAGMDGFTDNPENNYFDKTLNVERTLDETDAANSRWQKSLDEFLRIYGNKCDIQLITPSVLKIRRVSV